MRLADHKLIILLQNINCDDQFRYQIEH